MRGSADISPTYSSITAFKPRQILLLQQQQQQQPRIQSPSTTMAQLKSEDDSVLIFSVALWLKNKGFSKVFKRFMTAAQIEDDDWTAKALNLNEIFSKYQEICNTAREDLKFQEKQEEEAADTTEKTGDANGTASEKIKGKKKKKKTKDDTAINKSGETLEDTAMTEKINVSYENGNEDELAEDQSTKKPKEKKKKKSKLASQLLDSDLKAEVTEQKHEGFSSKCSKKTEAAEDEADESKKTSKKRKRMAPVENENQSGQEVEIEESKSKKSKGLEESKDAPPQTAFPGANGHAAEQEKSDNLQAAQVDSQKFSQETDESTINNNGIVKPSQKKSASKQPKSSEPNTVKAFQRVKIDEVEFVDERLQDNSYWAKDGAETGYGAKAQEVLGQVKGRGFRHEKTKKKRGSYRGGQIDLDSHSVKFKYSDEE